MMNFTYCPILGLSYFYTEPNIIFDLDALPNPSISLDEIMRLLYQQGINFVDSTKSNAIEFIGGITSNF